MFDFFVFLTFCFLFFFLFVTIIYSYISKPYKLSVFVLLFCVFSIVFSVIFNLWLILSNSIIYSSFLMKIIDHYKFNNFVESCFIVFCIFIIGLFILKSFNQRIIEVVARFSLDISVNRFFDIDNQLNAKEISEKEAEVLKEVVRKEIDFYSSVDGSSRLLFKVFVINTFIFVLSIFLSAFIVLPRTLLELICKSSSVLFVLIILKIIEAISLFICISIKNEKKISK